MLSATYGSNKTKGPETPFSRNGKKGPCFGIELQIGPKTCENLNLKLIEIPKPTPSTSSQPPVYVSTQYVIYSFLLGDEGGEIY